MNVATSAFSPNGSTGLSAGFFAGAFRAGFFAAAVFPFGGGAAFRAATGFFAVAPRTGYFDFF